MGGLLFAKITVIIVYFAARGVSGGGVFNLACQEKLKLHKVLMPKFGKIKKSTLVKVSHGSKLASAKAAASSLGESPGGPLVGKKVRVVAEEIAQIFGADAIVKQQFPEYLLVQDPNDPRCFKVRPDDIDVLDLVVPTSTKKQLALNMGERAVLLWQFPDICDVAGEGLQMNQMLSGDHLLLQHWVSSRDLIDATGSKFALPAIVDQFVRCALDSTDEAKQLREKAGQILVRQCKRFGLLGLPIFAAEHWTLLVFRKIAEKMHVRYYESLTNESPLNRSVASHVLQFLKEEVPTYEWPDDLPPRSNTRSRQINGIDCGLFAMWFWEGEMRRFVGEGWSLPLPTTSQMGPIYKMRQRLVALVKQMQKLPAEKAKADEKAAAKAKAKAKGKAAAAAPPADPEAKSPEEAMDGDAKVTVVEILAAQLQILAERTFKQGSVMFYGCSKCRWSRGGCISYTCNPQKFEKHYADHPEKYKVGTKELTDEATIALKNKEMVGGGCEVRWGNKDIYMSGRRRKAWAPRGIARL